MIVYITAEMLLQNFACGEQVERFRRLWPDGLTLRSEAEAVEIARSVARDFDFDWAGDHLLSTRWWAEFRWSRVNVSPSVHQLHNLIMKGATPEECARARYDRVAGIAEAFARAFWKQEVSRERVS